MNDNRVWNHEVLLRRKGREGERIWKGQTSGAYTTLGLRQSVWTQSPPLWNPYVDAKATITAPWMGRCFWSAMPLELAGSLGTGVDREESHGKHLLPKCSKWMLREASGHWVLDTGEATSASELPRMRSTGACRKSALESGSKPFPSKMSLQHPLLTKHKSGTLAKENY